MKVGTLEIELLANMARLAKDMHDAKRSVTGTMASIEKAVASAKVALGGFAAGFSAVAAVSKLIEVQRQFDVLNASLITATGSASNAAVAFDALEDFAATTPFGLAEVTDAFVKMRNLGLDPSEAALRSYGNTASAMGKSLNQFIEAVADASTSEFERLKEFGIKASQEGDKVSLTFRGVTTRIGNNADEIQRYLKALGENEFAGAMEERAKTLDGAISNLGDTWDKLFRQVSSQNTGSLIHDSVLLATGALEDMITIMRAMSSEMDKGSQKAGAFGGFQEALATIFETVAVLGVNVAYVLRGIGTELGGMAAQAVAIAKLDFNAAGAIRDMMVEDAAKARAQVEADSARILNARKEAAKALETKTPTGDRLAQPETGNVRSTGPTEEQIKAAQRAVEASEKYIDSLRKENEEIGLNAEQLFMLKAAREAAKAPLESQRKAIMAEALALLQNRNAWEDQQAVLERSKESAEEYADLIERLRGDGLNLHEQVQQQQEYNDRLGLTREQIAALEAAKLEDAAASKEQSAALADLIDWSGQMGNAYRMQAEELRTLAQLKREGSKKQEFVEAQKAEADAAKKVWEDFSTNVQRNLGDTLYSGMRGDFDNIGDAWLAMIQRMVADAMAADLASLLFGGGKGGGNLGSLIGSIGNLFGMGGTDAYTASLPDLGGLNTWAASFDGGGYTGDGPRTGGLDGKGGFWAMMHPQETVVDHTKGQTAGKSVTISPTYSINIDGTTDMARNREMIRKEIQAGNARMVDDLQRAGVI